MTLCDALPDYTFHDSTINNINYDGKNRCLDLDVELSPVDFSDNLGHFVLKYEDVSAFEAEIKMTDIDCGSDLLINILKYDCDKTAQGYRIGFYIELMRFSTNQRQYTNMDFLCSNFTIAKT